MEKVIVNWHLAQDAETESVERHCHNCGKKVVFKDSYIRRHNANGKNIYKFAIYKCGNDHSWNKKLKIYKSQPQSKAQVEPQLETSGTLETSKYSKPTPLSILKCQELNIREIEIRIESVKGTWRLDKLLSEQLEEWSRSHIQKGIKKGEILVDQMRAKPNCIIREHQRITLFLS
jgi:hypothetical protein